MLNIFVPLVTSVGWDEIEPIHVDSTLLVVGNISSAIVNQMGLDLNLGQGIHNRGRDKKAGARFLSEDLRYGKVDYYKGKGEQKRMISNIIFFR